MYIDPNKLYGGPPQHPTLQEQQRQQSEERQAVLDMGKKILDGINTVKEYLTMDDMLDSRQACAMLKVKPNHLYVLVRKHQIPYHKPSGRLLFVRDELDQWLRTKRR